MTKPVFSVTKKDFHIEYFSGTGAGGQHRNRHKNCVRLRHIETGIIKTGQNNKERIQNLNDAFKKMTSDKRFLAYCEMKLSELEGQPTPEEKVEEMLNPKNLKIEVKENNKWVVENE
jgi:protein subunit release factor B